MKEIGKDDAGAIRLDDADLAALREVVRTTISTQDPVTGELRSLDPNVPEDLAAASEAYPIMQSTAIEDGDASASTASAAAGAGAARRIVGAVVLPEEPRTGSCAASKLTVAADTNQTNLFPMDPMQIALNMDQHAATLNEFTCLLPLIDVPVFVPGLLCLIHLGQHQMPTQSSYHLIRYYFILIQMIRSGPLVRTRVSASFDWLSKRLVEKTLTSKDVELVRGLSVTNMHYLRTEAANGDAAAAEAIAQAEAEVAKGKMHPHVVDPFGIVLQLLARDALTPEILHECSRHVRSVARQDVGAVEWELEHVSFSEDIFEEHQAATLEATDAICDLVQEAETLENVRDTIFFHTVGLLNIFELTIMRLLSEHCARDKFTIPSRYMGRGGPLYTQSTQPDPVADVHVLLLPIIKNNRELMTAAHEHLRLRTDASLDHCTVVRTALVAASSAAKEAAATGAAQAEAKQKTAEQYAADAIDALVPKDDELESYKLFTASLAEAAKSDDVRKEVFAAVAQVFRADTVEKQAEAEAIIDAAQQEIVAGASAAAAAAGVDVTADAEGRIWEPSAKEADIESRTEMFRALKAAQRAAGVTGLGLGTKPTEDVPEGDDGEVASMVANLAEAMDRVGVSTTVEQEFGLSADGTAVSAPEPEPEAAPASTDYDGKAEEVD